MGWGNSSRLRHVTSGRYLAATADNQVVTFHRNAATEEATAFVVRESKVVGLRTALSRIPINSLLFYLVSCLFFVFVHAVYDIIQVTAGLQIYMNLHCGWTHYFTGSFRRLVML